MKANQHSIPAMISAAPTHRAQVASVTTGRPALYTILTVALLGGSGCQFDGAGGVDSSPQVLAIDSQNHTTTLANTNNQQETLAVKTDESKADNPVDTAERAWMSTIHTDFKNAKSLVEHELDIDLSSIKLLVVDDAPINAEVALETQRLVSHQFGDGEFARDFLQQVMHPLDGTYAALYSSRLSSILISSAMLTSYERSLDTRLSATSRHSALMALLIHELVHAADDKRYDIHNSRALNFRASFAQSATFEGHAQWVTREICAKSACSKGLEHLDHFMFSSNETTNEAVQPVEAVSRNVLEYSYIEGERFISTLAKRANGEQLIDQVLSNPPHDPIQILAPGTYPDTARESRNQSLIQASRLVDHQFARKPWVGVETSPLKGVDLRSDPARRKAAVDGFTLLIHGMVSMQFYNQKVLGALPIEATILQAENSKTASLFANMLHTNTQQFGAEVDSQNLQITTADTDNPESLIVHIYRTAIDGDTSYRTAIAVAGAHVVQISGNTKHQDFLDDYAIKVLLNLNTPTSKVAKDKLPGNDDTKLSLR